MRRLELRYIRKAKVPVEDSIGAEPLRLVPSILAEIGDDACQEHFGVVLLDARRRPLAIVMLTVGTLETGLLDLKSLFTAVLNGAAKSIVIFHNHPSGDPAPSRADIEQTRRVEQACSLLDIELIDHIIVGTGPQADGDAYSIAAQGVPQPHGNESKVRGQGRQDGGRRGRARRGPGAPIG